MRAASLSDLPALTEIHNYYLENTHISFDVQTFTPEQRQPWFHAHSAGGRHQLLVAEQPKIGVVGYVCSGQFRSKEAYDTTVEASIACRPASSGKGVGSLLYRELFLLLAQEDVHRVVAGIAQPNPVSVRLHEKFEFRKIGTFGEVGRKFGKYWDVLWMEKFMR